MTDRERLIKLMRSARDLATLDREADFLLANGVTFATDTNVGSRWTRVEDEKPECFVSVLGHMTDAGDFPAVRECYRITTDEFYFPALMEFHPIDKWMEMPKEDET